MATRPGLKAVDLFDAVRDGRVKAVWIVATNPAASMPRAERVREALAACPFVVVADCWPTDTTRLAHVVLPAAGWGEKDGTVTNSERLHLAPARLPRRRPARPGRTGGCSPKWRGAWAGRDDFAYRRAGRDVSRTCGAVGIRERRPRACSISARSPAWTTPLMTHARRCNGRCPKRGAARRTARLFADGGFPTPDGRARMVPIAAGGRRRGDHGLSAAAQYRPRARPVAHHDPHRRRAAPDGPHRRAAAGAASRRRGAAAASRMAVWRGSPAPTGARCMRAACDASLRPGEAFAAHALDRPVRLLAAPSAGWCMH